VPAILAVDLGAESGRVVRAELAAKRLAVEEVSRFATGMVEREGHQRWDRELLETAGVEPGLMQEVVAPGTLLGPLTPPVRARTGLDAVPVIAPGSHDTASAVAATPAEGEDWTFISSGTWSLMGVETAAPITSAAARELNFTNEGGVCGTNRLLKNIMGLWLVQRCRTGFDELHDYVSLTRRAAEAPRFGSLIDPDDPRFLNPASMPEAIRRYCEETNQKPPQGPGAVVRCALESLALRYRSVLDELQRLHSVPVRRIHVLGGGASNELLCQMTADATGLEVRAGPVEATAIGNALVQAQALGLVGSLPEARELVRRSFELASYEPGETEAWAEALERFASSRTEP
jgi:rhamnulokinase